MSIFERLDDGQLEMLVPVLKQRRLKEGELLFEEGDVGDYMAVLTTGKLVVEVSADDGDATRTIVATFKAPEIVGEMSCLDPATRSATVRARGDAELLVLEHVVLESLRKNAPTLYSQILRGVARLLAERLDETTRRIAGFLRIKREPTQPRQPTWEELQLRTESGEPVRADVELPAEGVVKSLDDNTRRVLRSAMVPRRFFRGDVICLEGSPANEAYFVVRGRIAAVKALGNKNYRLTTITKGGCLGQRALLAQGDRLVTLRVSSRDAVLLCLDRNDFEALLEADSSLAIGFQRAITVGAIRQLRQANEMVAYLGARPDRDDSPNSFARLDVPNESMLDDDMESVDDVGTLASMYMDLVSVRD